MDTGHLQGRQKVVQDVTYDDVDVDVGIVDEELELLENAKDR